MAKAIALLSGGLDSTLAILIVKRQGVEVTAVTFLTQFGCNISDNSSCSKDPFPAAEKHGFTVKLSHLGDSFLDIVKNPKYGHGRNMNPCIDCRILMLREARELMRMTGADFIITGEVVGQRPMSQRKETLPMMDKEAGVQGYVLRPLSAKLLKPTIPELEGLVDREKLYAISGRGRRPQMGLAAEMGLTDYPNPAGGCLLTEPNYAHRLKELLSFTPDPSAKELGLLAAGRHFRLTPTVKLVVGRNMEENDRIEAMAEPGDFVLRAEDCGSPTALLPEGAGESHIATAASICARYSDNKNMPSVRVKVEKMGDGVFFMDTPAADESLIEPCRIQNPPPQKTRASI